MKRITQTTNSRSAIVLVVCAITIVVVHRTFAAHDQAHFAAIATRLVDRWARDNAALVDPALPDALAASLYNFEATYCYPGNETSARLPCERLVGDENAMYAATKKYFDVALLSGPSETSTYYEVLAEAIGSTAGATGWPGKAPNPYRCFVLNASTAVGVTTDRGTYQPSYPVRRICLRVGTYALAMTSQNQRSSATLTLATDISKSRLVGGPTNNPPPQILAPTTFAIPYQLLCITNQNPVRVDGKVVYGPGRDVAVRAPNHFATAVGIRIVIEDAQRTCSAACASALRDVLLDSIALWRAACARCGTNALEAVSVNGYLFVDERISRALDVGPGPGTGVEYFAIRFRPLVRYVRANAAVKRALDASPPVAEWAKIAAFVHNGTASPVIRLRLGGPGSACGGDPSLIACAGPNTEIELNVRDYQFTRAENSILGSGSQPVDVAQVLVHEVGHWFGLPHIDDMRMPDGRRAIMEEVYGVRGQCITNGELGLLDDAADIAWEQRLRACKGLRYPAKRVGR